MITNVKRYLPLLMLLAGGYILLGSWASHAAKSNNDTTAFHDQMNLALRQTGDQLLRIACDETTSIEPIKYEETGIYKLRLNGTLVYDSLPYVLSRSLLSYDIHSKYYVLVKPCQSENVVLGYSYNDLGKDVIACLGRDFESDCSIIQVTLPEENIPRSKTYLLGIGLFLFGLGTSLKPKILNRKNNQEITSQELKPSIIKVGNSEFDAHNQSLKIRDLEKSLTYRESKLLNYLVGHVNQVVDRTKIIEAVWGDEGIMVGRSLDVFISRLRKLIKEDELLQIKTVHGVGYRFDVLPPSVS